MLRELSNRDRQVQAPGGGGEDSAAAADLSRTHEKLQALIAKATEAVDRALSANHEKFLRANLQEGGQ